jgi:preprotein translocase subunit SecA
LVRAAHTAGREAFEGKLRHFKDLEARAGATKLGEQLLAHVMLSVLDEKWKDHLYDLDQLRAAIQYRAWGQKDPLIEYKHEAFDMFKGLMDDVRSTFTERWLRLQVEIGPPPPQQRRPPPMVATKPDADGLVSGGAPPAGQPPKPPAGAPPAAASLYAGVGRNDPCPCGSGKKFKKCHGAGV